MELGHCVVPPMCTSLLTCCSNKAFPAERYPFSAQQSLTPNSDKHHKQPSSEDEQHPPVASGGDVHAGLVFRVEEAAEVHLGLQVQHPPDHLVPVFAFKS